MLMQKKGLRILLLLFLFLVLTLGFNAFLTISSFKKNNLRNYFSLAETIAKRIRSQIETGLIFGKELEIFYGLKKILQKSVKEWPFITNTYICDINCSVITALHDIDKSELNTIASIINKNVAKDTYTIHLVHSYALILPIHKNNIVYGYLVFSLSKDIDEQIEHIIRNQIFSILVVAVVSFALLSLFIAYSLKQFFSVNLRRKISLIVTAIIISAQLSYALIITHQYHDKLTTLINQKLQYIHDSLTTDFQYLLKKGVSLKHVVGIDGYLHHLLDVNDELGCISIIDTEGRPIFNASRSIDRSWLKQLKLFNHENSTPLYDAKDFCVAYIKSAVNPEFVLDQTIGAYLDSATVLVLCFIFLGELNYIFVPFLLRQLDIAVQNDEREQDRKVKRLLRVAAFLFFFAYDMPLSFIPLYMEKFPVLSNLINKDVCLSLPITGEMLFATLTTVTGGAVSDRYGWRRAFYSGGFLAGIGLLIASVSTGPWFYLLSRSISGAGLGLLLISLQSSVMREISENRASGIANIFAGVLAGSLCGNVTGAMLAERWTFSAVFLLAGILIFPAIVYLFMVFRNSPVCKIEHKVRQMGRSAWKECVYNFRGTGLLLFIAIPVAMTLVGILYYLTPLYLKKIGISQGSIGRVLMIYGLCIIYLGPLFSNLADKMQNKLFLVILTASMSAFAILPLVMWQGVWPLMLAVLLVGGANACGSGSLIVFFLEITSGVDLSEQKKVSFFRTLERIGQIVGSFVFANLIALLGLAGGLRYLFIIFLAFILLFILVVLISESPAKSKFFRAGTGERAL
jgi:MFS family permease